MLKTLTAIIAVIALGAGVYFLAINPRIQNNQALNTAASAAEKRAVTVVAPTQTSSAPDLVLPGNIQANQQTSIYAGAFDPASRTLRLEVDVPNPHGRLFAGMYAHTRFSLPSLMALLIPNNAILIDAKGQRIVVVDSSNKIHIRSVKLGRDYGTKREILSGLDTQDQVVQNPADDLHEEMPVSIQRTT